MNRFVFIFLILPTVVMAQPAVEALNRKDISLEERYRLMKDNAQTFKDYKVIKQEVLNGVLAITLDSIALLEKNLAESASTIAAFEEKVKAANALRDNTLAAMTEMEYDATHMTVFGISFNKSFFASLVGIIIVSLLALLGIITGRLKMVYTTLKEKLESLDITTKEFEEYKRRALDKQMKISRELQDERNRLAELRS